MFRDYLAQAKEKLQGKERLYVRQAELLDSAASATAYFTTLDAARHGQTIRVAVYDLVGYVDVEIQAKVTEI